MDAYQLPANPFSANDPTPEVQEAIRLHAAAERATTVLGRAYSGAREASDAVRVAHQALDDAIRESAQTGKVHKDEVKMVRAIKTAEDAADPQIHNRRIALSVQAQREAVARYHAYCRQNLPALLNAFRPETHEAAEAVAEALASIAPVRERRGEIAARVSSLIGIARATLHTNAVFVSADEAADWVIAQEETEAPLPSDAVLRHYYPEQPATPEPDVALAAGDTTWHF